MGTTTLVSRSWFIFLLISTISLNVRAADDKSSGTSYVPGSTSDPANITARAAMLNAMAAKQQAEVAAMVGRTTAELNLANAANLTARTAYLNDLRGMLNAEYAEIMKQQNRLNALIEGIRTQKNLVERIRMGHTDPASFDGMMKLLATSAEFDAIREAFNRKLTAFPADNFVPNDDETGTANRAIEFPGGDVRRLILFVRKWNFSFEPLQDAHWAIMDGLQAVTKEAAQRILAAEQEKQAVRAARITELFGKP